MYNRRRAVVDLVIPAKDEQETLAALLGALPWANIRHVVVADNGSTDQTAKLASAGGAVVVHEPHPGYGAACGAGLAWIAQQDMVPDIVAFIDADLSDDPWQLPRLCDPITEGRADLVIGSRRRLAQPGALTLTQRMGNALACEMIRVATGHRYTDLGPMRAVRWSSLVALAMSDRTWGWTVEMQYKAVTHGLRITELDVPYRPRRGGKSKISRSLIGSAGAGWKITTTIAQLWWQGRRETHAARRKA